MDNRKSKFHSREEISEYYDLKMVWYSGLNLPLNSQIDEYITKFPTNRKIKILDVGCGPGTLGAHYKKSGHYVVGIDIAPKAIEKAKTLLDEAFVVDIEKEIPKQLKGQQFDLIVCADVLEHTFSPTTLLKNLRGLLKANGRIAISIPNIANYTIRLKLLLGNFDYRESGIMDDTHVRFFTEKTLNKMLTDSGFQTDTITASANNVFEKIKSLHKIEKMVTKLFYRLFGYQFLVLARKIE